MILTVLKAGGSQKSSLIWRVGGSEDRGEGKGRDEERGEKEETAHLERAPLAINPDGWARRAVVVVRAVRSARTPQTTSASLVGEGAPFASRTICGTGSSVLGAGAAVARVPLLVGGEDLAFSHITPCAKDTVRIANRALSASLAHRSVVYDAGDGVETARLARRGARRTRKRTETARVALRQLRRDGFTVSTTWTRHADMVDVAVVTFGRREKKKERERESVRESARARGQWVGEVVRVDAGELVQREEPRFLRTYLDHIPQPL